MYVDGEGGQFSLLGEIMGGCLQSYNVTFSGELVRYSRLTTTLTPTPKQECYHPSQCFTVDIIICQYGGHHPTLAQKKN